MIIIIIMIVFLQVLDGPCDRELLEREDIVCRPDLPHQKGTARGMKPNVNMLLTMIMVGFCIALMSVELGAPQLLPLALAWPVLWCSSISRNQFVLVPICLTWPRVANVDVCLA